jgi:hypothetical protein
MVAGTGPREYGQVEKRAIKKRAVGREQTAGVSPYGFVKAGVCGLGLGRWVLRAPVVPRS